MSPKARLEVVHRRGGGDRESHPPVQPADLHESARGEELPGGEGPANGSEFSEAEIDAAVQRLTESRAFADAERVVARAAPGLQRILGAALDEGGWFGEAHDAQVLKAATTPDESERITAVRTLLAEETRMGMMVGVAVGWALREELEHRAENEKRS